MKKSALILLFVLFFCIHQVETAAYTVREKDPYDFNQLKQDTEQLEQKYGDVLHFKTIGTSHFGSPILAVQLGKGEKSILLIGAHHGREWITSNLLMIMLERYAEAYQKGKQLGPFDSSMLDYVSIWFVPMLNPDGIQVQQGNIPKEHMHKILAMNNGKRNFSRWKANGVGIDLNRQYPAGWESLPTSKRPKFKGYRGTQPFQAKEVQALVSFVKETNPQMAVAYHSAGHEIYWQYGEKQNKCRDFSLASNLSELTGYKLDLPGSDATGGGFTDWFIHEFSRPAFTLELTDFEGETNPPIEKLTEEWKRNRYVGFYLVLEIVREQIDNAIKYLY